MRLGYGPMLIMILVLGVVLGIVFGGGVVYGRNTVKPATPAAGAGGAAGGAAGGQAAGGAGGANSGGGAANPFAGQTVGTVAGVQGDTLTVRAADGRTTTFATAQSTQVMNSAPANITDLRAGEVVAVSPGPPDAQGRTRASAVTVLPPALAAIASAAGGAPGGGQAARTPTPAR